MSTLSAPRKSGKTPNAGTLVSYNPATRSPLGEVLIAPPESIPGYVARARAAQPAWRDLGLERRAEFLRPLGKKLTAAAEALAPLLTAEMGKPLNEALSEVRRCGEIDPMIDGIVAALRPDVLDDGATESVVYHDPFGVCAAISPWNFPIMMPHSLVLPALVAGNTVVLKPSEESPLVAQAYAELVMSVVPRDVLQVIHGADEQGKALVRADVDLIAFTGSRAAGRHILSSAGGDLKRVFLELGGKDPLIVLDDADIAAAAKFAVTNSFRNAGQVCVSTERIYVADRVADRFEAEVARLTAQQKVGNGMEPGVTVGPMINATQRDHVIAQIDDAVKHGARVVAGGGRHAPGFVNPTVLSGVTHEMSIMKEETFGPVACIARVRGDDEAVRLANDTPYGLGAVVFGSPERARAVARRLDAGMIGINKSCGGAAGSPWVGAKQSGYGYHSGREGHRQFTQTRVVSGVKKG